MINTTQEEIMRNWSNLYDTPLVSIRCITYNQKAYIGQALDSMLMQKTNFPFVIIVHDDASTDGTADVIRAYEKKFPEIVKPIYERENQYSKKDGSLLRIMNEACSQSKYCACCEGDDYWTNCNKLQMQVNFLESHPNYSACAHNVRLVKINGFKFFRKTYLMYPSEEKILSVANFREICHVSSLLHRTDVLRDWPEFAYKIPTAGDVMLNAFLKLRGPIFRLSEEMSVYRRGIPGSWVKRVSRNPKALANQTNNSRLFFRTLMEHSPDKYRPFFLKQIEWMDFLFLKNSLDLRSAKREFPSFWEKISFKERIYLYYCLLMGKLKR